jgi:hypothetical protein
MRLRLFSKQYLGKFVISTLLVSSAAGATWDTGIGYAAGEGSIVVMQVPPVTIGFNGEVTKLVIKDNDIPFTEGSTFNVLLPKGVAWNATYSTDGEVAGATYHRMAENILQFTVKGSPTEINIPINVKIDYAMVGTLDLIVDAPASSAIPVGTLVFATVKDSTAQPSPAGSGGTQENPTTGYSMQILNVPTLNIGFRGEATKLVLKSDIPFKEGSTFYVLLPQGIAWNDTYSTDGTMAGATYHQMANNLLRFTVKGSPTEITIPINVTIDYVYNNSVKVVVEALPSSGIPRWYSSVC